MYEDKGYLVCPTICHNPIDEAESMKLYYQDENGEKKPFYMGCYGIGLGRIIATTIENNIIYKNDQPKGFSLPLSIAPYKLQIIYKDNHKDEAFKLYEKLQNKGINCIIDDRDGLSIGNRINDTYVLGTPYFTIIGDNYDGNKIEIEETKSGNKESISIENINDYLK